MVKAFTTDAGGALLIRSTSGQGTHVEIMLPRAAACTPPLDATDARYPVLTRLQNRLRSSSLKDVLTAWGDACRPRGLPQPARLEAALVGQKARTLVIAVDAGVQPPLLRIVRMGDELVRALDRAALGDVEMNWAAHFGTLKAAYRRALRSRCPIYQWARYSFGRGSPAQFERLILPAATDGETVSHIFGLVVMSNNVSEHEHED